MEKQIDQSLKASLDFLGTSWLLHPRNRVQRIPREDSTPILSKGIIKVKNFKELFDVISMISNSSALECTVSGNFREVQNAIKVLNSIAPGTIQGCSFNVVTDESTIYISNQEQLKFSVEKIRYLAVTDYIPNQKYSLVTEDSAGWLAVFRAFALIGMVSGIGIDYQANKIEVN